MSKEVKRFTLETRGHCDCGNPGFVQMVEQKRGRFVCYSHVRDLIAERDALLAERDRLAAENERLERDAKNDTIAYRAVIDRQEELRSELEALKKDAERYQWLRDRASMWLKADLIRSIEPDAEIDALMQES